MKLRKLVLTAGAASVVALTLASCRGVSNEEYNKVTGATNENDSEIFEAALGGFTTAYEAAKTKESNSERFAYMAKAEAELLASGVFLPTITRGGNFSISRVAYRTGSYALWGSDEYRYKNLLVSDQLIPAAVREDLRTHYKAAATDAEYREYVKSVFAANNFQLQDTYKYTYSEANETWDWLATSMASDTEVLTNLVDGLVEYDGKNQLVGALAESWDSAYDAEAKETTYTFHLRQGLKWVKNTDGTETDYAFTADDFVAGFQHMLDAQGGLEYLVEGVIKNASEYMQGKASFDEVGVKAVDDYTLEYTVEGNPSYFLTYLAYNIFQPMNRAFFESKGGAFGVKAFADAKAKESYKYGKTRADVLSIGAFYTAEYSDGSTIQFNQNENYWALKDTDESNNPTIKKVVWTYNDGSDKLKAYKDAIAGTISGAGLNTTAVDQAKKDGKFDTYAYVSETTSTTYFAANNLNRQTYVLSNGGVATKKSAQQAKDTITAMNNKKFRLALNRAFDKKTWNAASVGDEVALNSLRNMYTPYDFVTLSEDVTIGDKTFAAGSFYGDVCSYYLNKEAHLADVDLTDSNNSWYNVTEAKALAKEAFEELGAEFKNKKVYIDIFYYASSATQTAQAKAYKESIENALGDYVVVNTIEANTTDDYYACGYRSANGAAANYDVFYGSGWGPDYGDPSTYLDTFLADGAGYMTKTIGLW